MEREMTPLTGITYYRPPAGTTVSGLDGKVSFIVGPEQIPLLDEDYKALDGQLPGYDAVGRGVYQALRMDPGSSVASKGLADCKSGKAPSLPVFTPAAAPLVPPPVTVAGATSVVSPAAPTPKP